MPTTALATALALALPSRPLPCARALARELDYDVHTQRACMSFILSTIPPCGAIALVRPCAGAAAILAVSRDGDRGAGRLSYTPTPTGYHILQHRWPLPADLILPIRNLANVALVETDADASGDES